MTLTQTGSTVTGVAVIPPCSVCTITQQSVNGTVSGNVATVAITHADGSALVPVATLTISGSNMSTSWTGTSGTIAGTLAAVTLAPGAAKYDGSYNFFFVYPTGPGGASGSTNLKRFLIVKNSVVSSSDGTVTGTVDSFGAIKFSGPCPINSSVADWTGNMNASALAGSNFGQGKYTCRIAIGGAGYTLSWQAIQGG